MHDHAKPSVSVPPVVHAALRSPGRALETATRAVMERRLHHDFANVRIHADGAADAAAASLGAVAFTLGESIVFAAGRYEPALDRGRRLLAHELAHVVQQRAAAPTALAPKAGAVHEAEAERVAEDAVGSEDGTRPLLSPAAGLQLQGTPACPTKIEFSSDQPVHVPPCGTFTAKADVPVTWSLDPDPTPVDPGTTISATGAITIGSSQKAGQIKAVATGAGGGCTYEQPITIRSHPTGIASTSVVSKSSTDYGGVFDHVFTSADGSTASLDGVAVGERFIGVPSPTASTHAIGPPIHPFGGTFTLTSSTLTPDASDNWFLTAKGGLNGSQDEVTIDRSGINVGLFVASASNPKPAQGLPATMSLSQGLHWYCPQAAAASRWRMPAFVTVPHVRRLQASRGVVQFVTSVNGVPITHDYDGPVAVSAAAATPATTPPSAAAPAAPRTVRITATTLPAALPAGSSLQFTFSGADLGCTLARDPKDDHAATLTVGTTKGSVTVQVADSTGVNFARVVVAIA